MAKRPVPKKLAQIRADLGLSQTQMVKALNYKASPLYPAMISQFETGRNTYVNRAYDIVQVRDHIPRKEQRNLFDINDSVTSTGLPMVESASWPRDAGLKELPPKRIGSGTGTAPEPAPEPDTDET